MTCLADLVKMILFFLLSFSHNQYKLIEVIKQRLADRKIVEKKLSVYPMFLELAQLALHYLL